jgi:hypothetical protein
MRKPGTKPERDRPEAEVSQRRQRETREQIIRPLQQHAEHNQFASLIRASLTSGRRP